MRLTVLYAGQPIVEERDFLEVYRIVHGEGASHRRDPRERTPFKTPFGKSRQLQQQTLGALDPISELSTPASTPLRLTAASSRLEVVDSTPIRKPPGADLHTAGVRRATKSMCFLLPITPAARQVLEAEVGFSKRTLKARLSLE